MNIDPLDQSVTPQFRLYKYFWYLGPSKRPLFFSCPHHNHCTLFSEMLQRIRNPKPYSFLKAVIRAPKTDFSDGNNHF